MGRMRQMDIERVDAVDEPATGARWIIAKRSKQTTKDGGNETPETATLVAAAIEALQKDAELDVSEDAATALHALAEAHGLEFKLEKDEEDADGDAADDDTASEGDDDGAADDDAADDDEADDKTDDEADDDDEGDLTKRVSRIETAVEKLIELVETSTSTEGDKPAAEAKKSTRRRTRTSKQATGQDDLGSGGEPLSKSNGRVSYANVLDQ